MSGITRIIGGKTPGDTGVVIQALDQISPLPPINEKIADGEYPDQDGPPLTRGGHQMEKGEHRAYR
jgi:hypothetical protein